LIGIKPHAGAFFFIKNNGIGDIEDQFISVQFFTWFQGKELVEVDEGLNGLGIILIFFWLNE
jgi:hypothetical protein